MTLLEAGRQVPRSAHLVLGELAQDLEATWDFIVEPADVSAWMSRPAILRRVAAAFAADIPADVDRIVSVGPGALALASAVSLATGLPYCAIEISGRFGSLHSGETVVVVAALDRYVQEDAVWLGENSARISRRHALVGSDVATQGRHQVSTIYGIGPQGRLFVRERNTHDHRN